MTILAFIFWISVVMVLHVYVGYPAGICLKARWWGRHNVPANYDEAALPTVTVLIPAHNEGKWLAHKIENCLALDYPRNHVQILVASDGSTDDSLDIAKRYATEGIEVNHHDVRSGKTATLNRVVPAARGEILLLTDCNALLPANTLRMLVSYFRDPSVGSVSGEKVCVKTHSIATEGEGLYWRYESAIKTAESRLGAALGGTGQVMAVRRSLFPFIPVIGDDFYVPMKIMLSCGARSLFEPRVKAAIPAAASLALELERKIRAHVSLFCDLPHLREGLYPWKSYFWWRFLSHHVLRLFVPLAMIAAIVTSVLLKSAAPVYRIASIAQAAFYLAALIGLELAKRDIRIPAFYLPFYFVLANVAVLHSWGRWIRGKQEYAWQHTERMLPEQQSKV